MPKIFRKTANFPRDNVPNSEYKPCKGGTIQRRYFVPDGTLGSEVVALFSTNIAPLTGLMELFLSLRPNFFMAS
ncbi:MAG: hypothetical protein JST20_09935 [Bacteroidetes bacterium]|nr:hypothetical protein [Bacteroidota bacterium]